MLTHFSGKTPPAAVVREFYDETSRHRSHLADTIRDFGEA